MPESSPGRRGILTTQAGVPRRRTMATTWREASNHGVSSTTESAPAALACAVASGRLGHVAGRVREQPGAQQGPGDERLGEPEASAAPALQDDLRPSWSSVETMYE